MTDEVFFTKLSQRVDDLSGEMYDLLERLVKIESPTACKDGVNQVCQTIKSFCDRNQFETTLYEFPTAGASLVSDISGNCDKEGTILLMGHMDTAQPVGSFGPEILTKDETYYYGPGVLDCKGGLVVALYAARILKEAGYHTRPLRLVFSGDEENGHTSSLGGGQEVYYRASVGAVAAFNCESGQEDGLIAVARKGLFSVKIIVHGIAAHSGNNPEQGRNAILEAAHKIIAIEKLTNFQGTTFNCGVIKGGKIQSAVPDTCEIQVCVRFRQKGAEQTALAQLQKITDTVHVDGTTSEMIVTEEPHGPMEETEENLHLFRIYQKAAASLGYGSVKPYFAGGASDAFYTTEKGVPTICGTGIRGQEQHSPRERAVIASLPERVKILMKAILLYE
ncbi:MAG: M20/M25/M40 family metallo-hydrolase [Lachnospiraceae bacterium]|nr:M20/M25/M40 family metallo-hydrolase [Lachnospiraceae bacterium]